MLFQLWVALFSQDQETMNYIFNEVLLPDQASTLMIIYGLGAAGIFFILARMYSLAYKRREQLGLSPLESFLTKTSMYNNLIMASIPILSILVVLIFDSFLLSGFTYWLYMIAMPLFNHLRSKKGKKIFPELAGE